MSRIFSFSYTNEFCGICVGDTGPAVAGAAPKAGRRTCEGPDRLVPRRPWKGPSISSRVGKSKIVVKRRGEAVKAVAGRFFSVQRLRPGTYPALIWYRVGCFSLALIWCKVGRI